MENPFKRPKDRLVQIANAALPLLLDRVGGTAVVSEIELARLAERYGGSVAIETEVVGKGAFRLTLIATKPKPAEGPVC